ncbi:MAG TPA: MlaD family protein [Solirubrobacteraceae bacterium]|jgi:virulence factor Mce-like protein|nr:MlaD family protein [Solirubrobacteraceae bacterium]
MNKHAPSAARIMVMVAFGCSCIGLLLFLWISFGGTIPFAPQGYRLVTEFNQAVELSPQSDVRISGVSVGKVQSIDLDAHTGLTRAVIQIDSQYAPRPANTRAILRAKSLLGETYVELSPGTASGPKIPDGGTLPQAQVSPTVQLDQILSTFDPTTRHAFQVWQQQDGMALTNRGQQFNQAFAELYPFATNVDRVLAVLNRDSAATTTLLRDGGQVFSALAASPSALQGFIRNSNSVFAATAAQDRALEAAVRAFPAFTVATRQTIARVNAFATLTKPLVDELRPAARQLSPALEYSAVAAPSLRAVLQDIGPLTSASRAGVPAFDRFLNASVPWLARLTPYLGNLVPVFDYINTYRREIAAFFANSAATTQPVALNVVSTKALHYLRIANPVNPEVLAVYQHRLESNRANPYMAPGGYSSLASGLSVFGGYLCTNTPQPTIGPDIPASLVAILKGTYYTATPGGPPCKPQGSLGGATTGQLQAFPHLQPLP